MPFRTLPDEIARALDERRKHEADIKHRIYVRPESNRGLHVVKESLRSHEYVVGGPAETFAPGSVVPTGSNTGGMGEFIVSAAPPGRKGSSGEQFKQKIKDGCPVHRDDVECIGVVDDFTSHTVHAYSYTGKNFGGFIKSGVLPGILRTGQFRYGWISVGSNLLAFVGDRVANAGSQLVYWNLSSGAFILDSRILEEGEGGSPNTTFPPVQIDGSIYWGFIDSEDEGQAEIFRQTTGAADGGSEYGIITGNLPVGVDLSNTPLLIDATVAAGWGLGRDVVGSGTAWYHDAQDPDGSFLRDLRVAGVSMGFPAAGGWIIFRRFSQEGPLTAPSPSAVYYVNPLAHVDIPIWSTSGSGWGTFVPQTDFYGRGASVHTNDSGQRYLFYSPQTGKLLISDVRTTSPLGNCPSPLVDVEPTPQGTPEAMCIVG